MSSCEMRWQLCLVVTGFLTGGITVCDLCPPTALGIIEGI